MKPIKHIKRILCLILTAALLSAIPLAAQAQEVDLRSANVSGYPTIRLSGGFHQLYYDELGPDRELVFDPGAVGDMLAPLLEEATQALKTLDFNRVIDFLVEGFENWFGPIRMNGDGESVRQGLSSEFNNWDDWNLYDADEFEFTFDWRLDPVYNAQKLHEYLERLAETRPDVEKYNFYVQSGSGPVMMSFLKLYDPDLDHVASLVMDISMHNGTTMWGELAKRKLVIDTENLGKMNLALGDFQLQPLLRVLYESGLLEIIERIAKLAANNIIDRVYDEILIPLMFTMPVFWSYVPQKDYAAAKMALFKGNPDYAGLVAKLDYYRENVMAHADQIILDANARVKVAVRAGYGLLMYPLGKGSGVQSDDTVDTVYASLGATCAPMDGSFAPWYKQRKACGDGHDHISPDRVIDASTCLLPDQTWFTLNKPHGTEHQYGEWYAWFKSVPARPTVYTDERFPQYFKLVEEAFEGRGVYEPLEKQPEPSAFVETLKLAGLWVLKLWRWLLRLPLFWV